MSRQSIRNGRSALQRKALRICSAAVLAAAVLAASLFVLESSRWLTTHPRTKAQVLAEPNADGSSDATAIASSRVDIAIPLRQKISAVVADIMQPADHGPRLTTEDPKPSRSHWALHAAVQTFQRWHMDNVGGNAPLASTISGNDSALAAKAISPAAVSKQAWPHAEPYGDKFIQSHGRQHLVRIGQAHMLACQMYTY